MAQITSIVGIDICKAHLDVHFDPAGTAFRLPNSPAGRKRLLARLHGVRLVALEATGGLETDLLHALDQDGLAVRLLNPLQVRKFAEASGRLAKNDRIDAAAIAAFAAAVPGHLYRRNKAAERLRAYVSYRRQCYDELNTLRNQIDGLRIAELQRDATKRCACLQRSIARLDSMIAQIIKADTTLRRKAALLHSVPGVGPVLVATLLACLPELGSLSKKKIAALVGVAPYDRDSGARKRKRRIRAGRAAVRAVLYMAAMSAARHNPPIRAFAQRLKAAGKSGKTVLVAAMRKLIVTLNAMIANNKSWQQDHP